MSLQKVKTKGSGGKSHKRWGHRADVKFAAKRRRRREDNKAVNG